MSRHRRFYSTAQVCIYLATIPVRYVRSRINSFDVHKTTWAVFKTDFVLSYIQTLVNKFLCVAIKIVWQTIVLCYVYPSVRHPLLYFYLLLDAQKQCL